MRAPDDSDPLIRGLRELSGLGGDDDRAALDGMRARLAGRRLRVLVAGEAKRGKSTLVNALLGRPVLPVGVTRGFHSEAATTALFPAGGKTARRTAYLPPGRGGTPANQPRQGRVPQHLRRAGRCHTIPAATRLVRGYSLDCPVWLAGALRSRGVTKPVSRAEAGAS